MSRDEAVDAAIEALDVPTSSYTVELAVTTRAYHQFEIMALDDADAIRRVKAIDIGSEYGHIFSGDDMSGIEGDEIIYIDNEDGERLEITKGDDTLDMRSPGEPFSWDACKIVKRLAEVDPADTEAIKTLLEEAKAACRKET